MKRLFLDFDCTIADSVKTYCNVYNSIYKEDINNYVETSEILIGKNIDNMIKRKTIEEKYAKYRRLIPFEIVILIIISIIVIFL
jgi:hypothetical protein